jgi:hypothetical protein
VSDSTDTRTALRELFLPSSVAQIMYLPDLTGCMSLFSGAPVRSICRTSWLNDNVPKRKLTMRTGLTGMMIIKTQTIINRFVTIDSSATLTPGREISAEC